MKALPLSLSLLLSITALCAFGEEGKDGKNGLVVGVITAVKGDTIEVFEKRGKKTHALKMSSSASKNFVGALKETKEIKVGYPVRAGVANGVIGNILITLPIKDVTITPTPEMVKMSPAELFKFADQNGDGTVSYVEYSTKIKASLKHGPVSFSKSDVDKSGGLNVKEFETSLGKTKWWNMSRKTPAEWFEFSDKDNNQKLSKEELAILLGSTAHITLFFKRADRNASGDLDLKEVSAFINELIFPSQKGRKK